MNHKIIKVVLLLLFCHICLADITDTFNNDLYLTETLNSNVAVNGDSTVSMTISASGDSVIDWYKCCYVRVRPYNDKVTVAPTAAIGAGQYSLWILFFDSSENFLAEVKWCDTTNDTNFQTLKNVTTLAAANGASGAEYYWIRFRLHGNIGDGFIFDEIRVREGVGYWPPTALTTAAPKVVFAHEMVGFKTPEYSGYWQGWNQYSHSPWVLDANGKPDIASVNYPSVGPYDMADPNLVEYHCQSLKTAGINGVIFDLGFYAMDTAGTYMINDYLAIMANYDLQAVICYEDKAHWLWDAGATTRAMAVQRAYEDMTNWLNLFKNSGRQYNVTGTRPLFLLFSYVQYDPIKGISCLSSSEVDTWLNTFSAVERPVILRQWFDNPDYVGIFNGMFGWPMLYPAPPEMSPYVGYCDWTGNENTLENARDTGQSLFTAGDADFHIPGVWPGFDDYAVWGWGDGPRYMDRLDGQTYDLTWEYAIDDNLPVVQIATWNDWFEATIIESAVEFGNLYLEKTFTNSSLFKNLPTSPVPDFNVPIWIYKIRDITSDPLVLADMTTASSYIAAGQFDLAEQIVQPWADYFAIDSVIYWTGSDSIATEPNIQTETLVVFDTITIDNTDLKVSTITNNGTAPLEFSSVSIISGQADFTIVGPLDINDLSVAQSRQIAIEFTPQTAGIKTGILQISTNDPDQPILNINLDGTASAAGDYFPDDKINFKDLAEIGLHWQSEYDLYDLKSITDNWLD